MVVAPSRWFPVGGEAFGFREDDNRNPDGIRDANEEAAALFCFTGECRVNCRISSAVSSLSLSLPLAFALLRGWMPSSGALRSGFPGLLVFPLLPFFPLRKLPGFLFSNPRSVPFSISKLLCLASATKASFFLLGFVVLDRDRVLRKRRLSSLLLVLVSLRLPQPLDGRERGRFRVDFDRAADRTRRGSDAGVSDGGGALASSEAR